MEHCFYSHSVRSNSPNEADLIGGQVDLLEEA